MKLVLPFFSGDTWLLLKNLDWYAELDSHIDRDCVLACDDQTDPKEALAKAKALFRSVTLLQYPRATDNRGRLVTAWPVQQNNAFANTARFMAQQKEPWFWCETDCTPLAPGWWKTLEDEYAKGSKPFGGHWNAESGIFNGVAVYPPKVSRYSQKALLASFTFNQKTMQQSPWDAYCSQEVFPHLHQMNNVMQHLWSLPGQTVAETPTFPDMASVEKYLRPGVVLFHRCKDGSLLDRMREIRTKQTPVDLRGIDKVKRRKEIPATDIFIVSFRRDLEFTKYCLLSIAKFAQGFHRVILLVPEQDKREFLWLGPKYIGAAGVYLKTFDEVAGKGMLHHEAMICSADMFCNADYILHIDADCIFKEPVTPLDYFHNGKPIMLKESYARLVANGGFDAGVGNWQTAVEKALGFKPQYETMRRHPEIYPRTLYPLVRQAVEEHTRKPFLDYVLSCRNEYPQGFAEFDTIGAWALQHAPDLHYWINLDFAPRPPEKLYQMSGKHDFNYVPSDGPLKGRRYGDVIKEVLGA